MEEGQTETVKVAQGNMNGSRYAPQNIRKRKKIFLKAGKLNIWEMKLNKEER
jgi:hypothetical protein